MQTIYWRVQAAAISFLAFTASLAADTPAAVLEVDAAVKAFQAGRYSEAEAIDRKTLAILEQTERVPGPQTAAYLNNLASVYSSEGKYAAAEEHYQKALGIWQRIPGSEASVALALNNLGVLLRRQARYS